MTRKATPEEIDAINKIAEKRDILKPITERFTNFSAEPRPSIKPDPSPTLPDIGEILPKLRATASGLTPSRSFDQFGEVGTVTAKRRRKAKAKPRPIFLPKLAARLLGAVSPLVMLGANLRADARRLGGTASRGLHDRAGCPSLAPLTFGQPSRRRPGRLVLGSAGRNLKGLTMSEPIQFGDLVRKVTGDYLRSIIATTDKAIREREGG